MPEDFVAPKLFYAQLARIRQGAGTLITSPDGRVVMCDVTYRDYLELPSGAAERTNRHRWRACGRDGRNSVSTSRSGVCSSLIIKSTEAQGNSVMFVYDGGVVVEESALHPAPSDEGRGVVLVDPKNPSSVTISLLADRIRHALTARGTGGVVETVNGESR